METPIQKHGDEVKTVVRHIRHRLDLMLLPEHPNALACLRV